MELRVLDDVAAIAAEACQRVCTLATATVAAHGRFTIALSGGSTPKALYRLLAQHPELPWGQIELFFGDERAVPPDHLDSNARMVEEALTHHDFVPAPHVHRIRAELGARAAATDYERTLRTRFADGSAFPHFDLVLLGLGADGHTASLFPHTEALGEREAWVCASWVDKLKSERITLTYPVLNAARAILFLVAGADKAAALAQVLEGDAPVETIPARGVRPAGQLTFLVDHAAAADLTTAARGD